MFQSIKNVAGKLAAHALLDTIYGVIIVGNCVASVAQLVREHH